MSTAHTAVGLRKMYLCVYLHICLGVIRLTSIKCKHLLYTLGKCPRTPYLCVLDLVRWFKSGAQPRPVWL